MRPDPSGQIAVYLATNRNFLLADVWTFATVYGEVLQYSGYETPVSVPASMFDVNSVNAGTNVTFGLGPRFGRSKITTKVGLQADSLALEIYAGATDFIGSYTWQAAFFHGVFDQATVELGRVVCQPGVIPVGYVVWFKGLVGEVTEIGRTTIKVTVDSTLTLLSTQYPRRLWQHTCSHIFGDAMCQFDRQSRAVSLQAGAGSTAGAVQMGFVPNPVFLYTAGTIVGVSGANANIKRSVADATTGIAYLTAPFVYPVAAGDQFYMLPGCDHTLPTCRDVFNNLQHFGGQPYIPAAEFAL